jgi:aldehyde dehydrogenase (NAD+)/betaine-aldehyde dehydrogenase
VSDSFYAVDPASQKAFAGDSRGRATSGELVEDAHRALEVEHDWRDPDVRARTLARLARDVEAQAEPLAELECRDTGKPLSQARADVAAAVRYLEFYAGAIGRLEGRQIPLGPGPARLHGARAVGRLRPGDLVELPAPARRPLRRAGAGGGQRGDPQAVRARVGDAAAARRAGGERRRAARDDPRRDRRRRRRRRARLAPRRRSRDVRGQRGHRRSPVAEACARRLAPLELELGGKSPNVVFADADLGAAVPAIVRAAGQNAGQSCSAGSRLLVERAIYDDVIARVARRSTRSRSGRASRTPTSAR